MRPHRNSFDHDLNKPETTLFEDALYMYAYVKIRPPPLRPYYTAGNYDLTNLKQDYLRMIPHRSNFFFGLMDFEKKVLKFFPDQFLCKILF